MDKREIDREMVQAKSSEAFRWSSANYEVAVALHSEPVLALVLVTSVLFFCSIDACTEEQQSIHTTTAERR